MTRFLSVWLIVLTALIAGFWWWMNAPTIEFILPDSGSYLRFDSFRSTGYPLLLDLIRRISEDDYWVKASQLAMMLIAFSWLSIEVSRFFAADWVAWPLQISLIFNPLLMQYAFTVLTDAVFITFLSIWLIATLRMLRSGSPKLILLLWTVLGAFCFSWIWLIKSLSLVWLPVVLFVFVRIWRKEGVSTGLSSLGVFLLILSIVHGAGAMYRLEHVNENSRSDFFGRQLFGKTAFVQADPQVTQNPQAAMRVNQLMGEIRTTRNSIADYRKKFMFSENFYDYIRFKHFEDIFDDSDSIKAYSLSVITHNWREYLNEVAMTVAAIWSVGELETTRFASDYNNLLDSLISRLPEDVTLYRPSGRSLLIVILFKGFVLVALIFSFWSVFRFFTAKNNRYNCQSGDQIFALFLIAIAAHTYVVGVALLQTALIRYLMGMWPLVVVLVFGNIALIGRNRMRMFFNH